MKNILISLILCFVVSSCISEQFSEKPDDALQIQLEIPEMKDVIVTKSSSEYDNIFRHAKLIMFNATTGDKILTGSISDQDGKTPYIWRISGGQVADGTKFKIVALANNGNELAPARAYDNYPDWYTVENNINSFSYFDNNILTLKDVSNLERNGLLVMVGYAEGEVHRGANILKVPLKRVDAKISFKILGRNTVEDGFDNSLIFTPIRWRICNVPKKVRIIANADDSWRADSDYEKETLWHNFESKSLDQEGNPESEVNNQFVAYVPHNKLEAQRPITSAEYNEYTGKNISEIEFQNHPEYAFYMRSRRVKTPDAGFSSVTNGDFIFAPKNATYIEVEGRIFEKLKQGGTRSAVVKYTLPLGYARNAGGLANDYYVEANHNYIISATVRGVDNIVLEVTDNNNGTVPRNTHEFDTNSEGDVSDNPTGEEFDAHYSTFIRQIPASILDSDLKPLDFDVDTPFDHNGMGDYKWIRFVILPPGSTSLPSNLEQIAYRNFKESDTDYNGGFDQACDIGVLSTYLNKISGYNNRQNRDETAISRITGNTGNITIAGIINEYYYEEFPVAGNNVRKYDDYRNQWARIGWRTFVNQPNRLMRLYFKGNKPLHSTDKNSTYTKPDMLFSQKAIFALTTNVNLLDYTNRTMEGFEIIDEVDLSYASTSHRYPERTTSPNPYSTGGDVSYDVNTRISWNEAYGYRGTLAWAGLIGKSDITREDINSVNWNANRAIRGSMYTSATNAGNVCLSRNVDLNGNGRIDLNEVRWYTPAYRQLAKLSAATYVIPRGVRLVNTAYASAHPYFLVSTTDYDRNPVVVWANERFSRGNYQPDPNDSRISVRCIRNLGVNPSSSISGYDQGVIDPVKVRLPQNQWYAKNMQMYGHDFSSSDYYTMGSTSYPFAEPSPGSGKITGNGLVIDLRNMDGTFLRKNYIREGEIPTEKVLRFSNGQYRTDEYYPNELSPNELPYHKGFRVAMHVLGEGDSYNVVYWATYRNWYNHTAQQSDGERTFKDRSGPFVKGLLGSYFGVGRGYERYVNCGRYTEKDDHGHVTGGWRMPTTTELAIMSTYLPWARADVFGSDRRGWAQVGWRYNDTPGGYDYYGYSTWFGPIVSGTLPAGERVRTSRDPQNYYILRDSGSGGFTYVTKVDRLNSGTPPKYPGYIFWDYAYLVRCVKDWDPDIDKDFAIKE